jgi:indole-3-glycerol phosphate synthase
MLLGINNRDLRTGRADLATTTRLADLVEDKSVLVSMSGVSSARELMRVRQAGVRIVMMGAYLMRQDDPGEALRRLIEGDGESRPGGELELKS